MEVSVYNSNINWKIRNYCIAEGCRYIFLSVTNPLSASWVNLPLKKGVEYDIDGVGELERKEIGGKKIKLIIKLSEIWQ
jgi:hypothetical protein